MSFSQNETRLLWSSFMPLQQEIKNKKGSDLYSLQIYPPDFFNHFNPETIFEKWAAVEVTDFSMVPSQMESLVIPEGTYVVFLFKGNVSEASKAFQYIFNTWLPGSGYQLDNRPHFELLGERYKNNDPDSEEEIWIPVKTAGNR